MLRARICSGQSGQNVVDLADTGSPIRGRVKLRRLRLAVPGIKGNEAMRRNEPTESVRVESSILERSAADGTPNKCCLRGEFQPESPGHDEGRPLGNALDRTTELVQQALLLFLEGFLVASKVVWMLVAVEEFNSTRSVNVFTDLQSTCDFVFWYLFYLNAPMKNMSYDLCTPQAFLGFKTW